MSLAKLKQWARNLFFTGAAARRRFGIRPRLEALENRVVPATRTWDGGAASTALSNAVNWQGNVAPVDGDDLVFPQIAADFTVNNDLPGRTFRSLFFGGSNYNLNGNALTISTGGITSTTLLDTNTVSLDIAFQAGTHSIDVEFLGTLNFAGTLSGSANLVKLGDGTLRYSGTDANTYAGTTTVNAGRLELAKSSGVTAIAGPLTIGNGSAPNASARDEVRLLSNNQIADSALVTIHEFGQLNLTSRLEGLNSIQMSAGEVIGTATSRLSLRNAYTSVQPIVLPPVISPIISVGQLNLLSPRVEFNTLEPRKLEINSEVGGAGGFIKTGSGELILSGSEDNTFTGTASIEKGVLTIAKPNNTIAISGPLFVGSKFDVAFVEVFTDGAFDSTQPVNISPNGRIFLFDHPAAFGPLTMTGGTIDAGVVSANSPISVINKRRLILIGDVTIKASDTPAVIQGVIYFHPSFGTRTFNVADGSAPEDLILNGLLSIDANVNPQTLGFTKTGTGTMAVNLDASPITPNKGRITLADGTLRMNGNNPAVEVRVTGGVLESDDNASISNLIVTGSGLVSPGGNGTGILRTGFVSIGDLRVDLNGTAAGAFDQLVVSGAGTLVQIAGNLDVHLGFTPAVGDSFKLIDNQGPGTASGAFFNAPGSIIVDGQTLLVGIGAGDGNDVVLLRNDPPMFQNRQVTTPIEEGGQATVSGHIVEPNAGDTFFLDVTWGDGSPQQTFTFLPGTPRDIAVSHLYKDDSDFTINLLWRDQHGSFNTGTLSVHVDNVAPTLSDVSITPVVFAGQRAVLTGSFSDPGVRDTFTVVVNWGDGSAPETIDLRAGSTRFALSHRYAQPGDYKVRLTLLDDDGGKDQDVIGVKVKSGRWDD